MFYRSMITASTLWLILTASVSALDLRIRKVSCQSREVQIHFDYLCNGDNICTFGESETLEGAFIYYGLVDVDEATAADSFVINATLAFELAGYSYTQDLITNLGVPLCDDAFVADGANEEGDCPNDGNYVFNTLYEMPAIASPYVRWAASGWAGKVVLDIYLNSTLDQVGKCTMLVETLVTGSYEGNAFKTAPSAKIVAYSVLGSLALCLALCLCNCCCAERRSRRSDARQQRLLAETDSEIPPMKKDETILM